MGRDVIVQTYFTLIDGISCQILSRAVLLYDAGFEILKCRIRKTWTFSVIFIIQHTEKVKAVPTPVEIDLLKKDKCNACIRLLCGH